MVLRVGDFDTNCMIGGAGPHLLFLHGWGVGHESYLPLLEHLQKTHTIFAPDLPGFGKTPDPPVPWTAREYSSFILDFIKTAEVSSPILMGHSNGGRLLTYMLGTNALTAKKLVLIDSAGVKPKRRADYYAKVYSYKLAKLLLTPFPNLKQKYGRKKGSADYRSASPVMRGTLSNLVNTYTTQFFPSIKPSTLIIWGKDDTATPLSDAKLMERSIPDAGLVEINGGHWAFIEQLQYTCRVLDSFLGGGK